MPVQVIVFGQLTDIMGHRPFTIDNVADTHQLVEQLQQRYPGLEQASYAIAVDKQVVVANTPLNGDNTVALLPPFAGG